MKKNLLYAFILVALLGFAWWLTQQDDRSTLDPLETSFNVTDTAAVDRIFIADKAGRTILAERQPEGYWMVNNTYRARPDVIEYLLATLLQMQVKSPVPRAAIDNVKSLIASVGKKVEVYSQGKKLQVFYVGHATIDSRGTYVIKEGAELPYIVQMPGWEGYISPRFFTNLEQWRERVLFRLSPDSIQEIKVRFYTNPSQDYILRMPQERRFQLLSADGKTEYVVNLDKAKAAFRGPSKFVVEGFENRSPMRDSILEAAPVQMNYQITEKNGQTHSFNTYFKSQLNQLDVVLLQSLPDLDRDYFYYQEGNEFGILPRRTVPWFYFTLQDLKEN